MITLCLAWAAVWTAVQETAPFRIDVVDGATGRGVPLVELRTSDSMRWWSDNAGVVAVREPSLVGRTVWFGVTLHGGSVPADGFGGRGIRCEVVAGGQVTVEIDRHDIAERWARTTGRELYRGLRLCGEPLPYEREPVPGDVTGLDSVQVTTHGDRLLWLFGDTYRQHDPLGNFHTTGAWTPSRHLDVERGFDLRYIVGDDDAVRAMAPLEGPGAVWLDGLCTLETNDGPRTFAHFVRLSELGPPDQSGVVEFDAARNVFVSPIDLPRLQERHPHGHAVLGSPDDASSDFVYFGNPYPSVRIPRRADAFRQPETWEAFTALRIDAPDDVERDASGHPIWGWKPAEPLGARELFRRAADLGLAHEELWITSRDATSGRPLYLQAGSVHWSPHRDAWVMIATELGGEHSNLGDVWFCEADTRLGPWTYARRIVEHDRYSYYNPRWFPELGLGRWLWFEGTFATTFAQRTDRTPLYDYNQVRFRLDLDDDRLTLPTPVWIVTGSPGQPHNPGTWLAKAREIRTHHAWPHVVGLAFFSLPRAVENARPLRRTRHSHRDSELGWALGDVGPTRLADAQLVSTLPAETLEAMKPLLTPAYVWDAGLPHWLVRQLLEASD